jgi:heme oxygenase
MMLDLLKFETQQHHRALENKMPLMKPTLTLDVYKQIIKQFLTYYLPLEALILAQDHRQEKRFNYCDRLKAPLLKKDLNALHINIEEHVSAYRR